MKLNWNFLGGGVVQNKKPSVREVWIFSGTAHWKSMAINKRSHVFSIDWLLIINIDQFVN